VYTVGCTGRFLPELGAEDLEFTDRCVADGDALTGGLLPGVYCSWSSGDACHAALLAAYDACCAKQLRDEE